jgi:predicted TIM-barrel fold metal-dependent hydrolase
VTRPRVVDSHVHVWRDAQPGRPYPWPAEPDPNTIDAMLAVLDAAGVDAAVQVTPSTVGLDNSYGLAAAAAHPGRFTVFGRFDTGTPGVRERLAGWLAQPGAVGVRLTFMDAPVDEEHEFWSVAEELDAPVAVFAPGRLEAMVRVLERHPGLRLTVDHLGLDVYADDPFREQPLLVELAPFEHVTAKISGLVETSRERFPFRDVHEQLARACETLGTGRLIWGSNYPVVLTSCSYAESLEFLGECDFLADGDLELLLARSFEEWSRCASPS